MAETAEATRNMICDKHMQSTKYTSKGLISFEQTVQWEFSDIDSKDKVY